MDSSSIQQQKGNERGVIRVVGYFCGCHLLSASSGCLSDSLTAMYVHPWVCGGCASLWTWRTLPLNACHKVSVSVCDLTFSLLTMKRVVQQMLESSGLSLIVQEVRITGWSYNVNGINGQWKWIEYKVTFSSGFFLYSQYHQFDFTINV